MLAVIPLLQTTTITTTTTTITTTIHYSSITITNMSDTGLKFGPEWMRQLSGNNGEQRGGGGGVGGGGINNNHNNTGLGQPSAPSVNRGRVSTISLECFP